jgi:hypothetical protein
LTVEQRSRLLNDLLICLLLAYAGGEIRRVRMHLKLRLNKTLSQPLRIASNRTIIKFLQTGVSLTQSTKLIAGHATKGQYLTINRQISQTVSAPPRVTGVACCADKK